MAGGFDRGWGVLGGLGLGMGGRDKRLVAEGMGRRLGAWVWAEAGGRGHGQEAGGRGQGVRAGRESSVAGVMGRRVGAGGRGRGPGARAAAGDGGSGEAAWLGAPGEMAVAAAVAGAAFRIHFGSIPRHSPDTLPRPLSLLPPFRMAAKPGCLASSWGALLARRG